MLVPTEENVCELRPVASSTEIPSLKHQNFSFVSEPSAVERMTTSNPLLLPEIVEKATEYLDCSSIFRCRQVCRTWKKTVDRIQPWKLPKKVCETARIFCGDGLAELHISLAVSGRILPRSKVFRASSLSDLDWRLCLNLLKPKLLIFGPVNFQQTAELINLLEQNKGALIGCETLCFFRFDVDHSDDLLCGKFRKHLSQQNKTLRRLKIEGPGRTSFQNLLETLVMKDDTVDALDYLCLCGWGDSHPDSVFTEDLARLTTNVVKGGEGHLKELCLMKMKVDQPNCMRMLLEHWLTVPIIERTAQLVAVKDSYSRFSHFYFQSVLHEVAVHSFLWSALDSDGVRVGSGRRGITWAFHRPVFDIPPDSWPDYMLDSDY